jgi:hypothetical protein
MIRQTLMKDALLMEGDFRVRGANVSRVEAFSDAAFAFVVTLLVISLEVPQDYDQLLDVLKGIPSFAVCFTILVWSSSSAGASATSAMRYSSAALQRNRNLAQAACRPLHLRASAQSADNSESHPALGGRAAYQTISSAL